MQDKLLEMNNGILYDLPFREPLLVEEINKSARLKSFEKDDTIMNPGDEILFIPIVLKGETTCS